MLEQIGRIVASSSYQSTHATDIKDCLEKFCTEFVSTCVPSDLVYVQHLALKELKQRFSSCDDCDKLKCLLRCLFTNCLPVTTDGESPMINWHRWPLYHAVCAKVLQILIDRIDQPEDSTILKSAILEVIVPILNQSNSFVWKSFDATQIDIGGSCGCSVNHCYCESAQCLNKLLQLGFHFVENLLEDPRVDCQNLDRCILVVLQQFCAIIEKNSLTKSNRCLSYEYLRLCTRITCCQDLSDSLDWICGQLSNITSYVPYFETPRHFGGVRVPIDEKDVQEERQPSESESTFELLYDCVLLRCYITLSMKVLSKKSIDHETKFENFIQHLSKLKSSLKVSSNSKNVDLESWLIDLYVTEDSELFEMLYLTVIIFYDSSNDNNNSVSTRFIHRLFSLFVDAISGDSSVLLEMLTTDGATADILLKFLLVYLKIPLFSSSSSSMDSDNNSDQFDNIPEIFRQLSQKIHRLNSKNLFPYNPKPLLRLLDNFGLSK